MSTALILLFLLALAAIPGSLIPQTRVDASEVSAFKDRHPDLAPFFDRIGMFNVYSSVWFSAIYVLLMVSLIGCFIPRLRVYLSAVRARPPKAPKNLSRFAAYDTWTSDESVETEAERIRDLLRKQRRRVDLVARRRRVHGQRREGVRARGRQPALPPVAAGRAWSGSPITGLYGFKGNVLVVQGKGFSNTLTPVRRVHSRVLASTSQTWRRSASTSTTSMSSGSGRAPAPVRR